MKKLFSWLRPKVTKIDLVIAAVVIALLSFGFSSCGKINLGSIDPSDPTFDLIASEAVDTFGYTLGLLAAKDPYLKDKVKSYYDQVKQSGLTVTIVNEALQALIKSDNIAYRVLTYKMTRLAKLFAVKFDESGNVTDFGALTDKYLGIGKDAYLTGLVHGGAA